MINWRIILGIILLFVGVMELYTLINNATIVKGGTNPLYAGIACGAWMLVGLYLIVRGITMNKTN